VIFIYFVAILVPWHYTLLGILPLFLLVVLLNYVLAYDFALELLPLGCRGYAPVSPPTRILTQFGCKFGHLPASRCVLFTYICRFYFLLNVQQELSLQTTDRAILVVVFKESLHTRKFKQSLLQSCMQGCNPETSKT
jgi:hypothetical protein